MGNFGFFIFYLIQVDLSYSLEAFFAHEFPTFFLA